MKTRKGLKAFFDNGKTIVRLYQTNIVVYNGSVITLNSGGWLTKHTKNCMNDWLKPIGYYVSQRKGVWYVSCGEKERPFKDGMQLSYVAAEVS